MIRVDAKQLEKAKYLLTCIPDGYQKAIYRAINRAAAQSKTLMVSETVKSYHISRKDVSSTIKITKAETKRLNAFIKSRGTRRELIQFMVLPNKLPSNINGIGPFIAQKRGSSTTYSPRTFVNFGSKTGNPHVFTRGKGQRQPLIKYGLSVPQMLGNDNLKKTLEEKAQEFIETRLEHEIDVLLRGVIK